MKTLFILISLLASMSFSSTLENDSALIYNICLNNVSITTEFGETTCRQEINKPISEWNFVGIENNRVKGLSLSGLISSPSSFSGLDSLRALNLSLKNAYDTLYLSSSISSLSGIKLLILSNGVFINIDSAIQSLDLERFGFHNAIDGESEAKFPLGVCEQSNLKELNFDTERRYQGLQYYGEIIHIPEVNVVHQLDSIPSCVSNLVNIDTLKFSGHRITDVPNLNQMVNLKFLRMDKNQITDLPDFSNNKNIDFIALCSNQISSFDYDFSVNDSLRVLSLNRNKISTISYLDFPEKFQSIDFSYNQLATLPEINENDLEIRWTFGNNQLTSLPITIINQRHNSIYDSEFGYNRLTIEGVSSVLNWLNIADGDWQSTQEDNTVELLVGSDNKSRYSIYQVFTVQGTFIKEFTDKKSLDVWLSSNQNRGSLIIK